uniref:SFRICE_031118 n=1 Tax=Spodoptera frugiperda TaxID=7108 RepID=A0A2H1WG63_SPOFR
MNVIFTVNTNLTTPRKPKSFKPFRLQSVPNNYTNIHILEKHNPLSGAIGRIDPLAFRGSKRFMLGNGQKQSDNGDDEEAKQELKRSK